MATVNFTNPFRPAFNIDGGTENGATLTFYRTGSTTIVPIYANSGLSVELPNPVAANAAGVFPEIYLDDTVIYNVVLKDGSGTVLGEIDPYYTLASDLDSKVASANASAEQAEAYVATVLAASGPNYASTAAGLAATSNGEAFAVDVGNGLISIYLNSSGTAVLQRGINKTPIYLFENRAALEAFTGDLNVDEEVALRDSPGTIYKVVSNTSPLPTIETAGGDRLREIGRKSGNVARADWKIPQGHIDLGDPWSQDWTNDAFQYGWGNHRKTYTLVSTAGDPFTETRPNAILPSAHGGWDVIVAITGNSGQNQAAAYWTDDFINFYDRPGNPIFDEIQATWQSSRMWVTAAGYDENKRVIAWVGGNNIANTANWGERAAGIAVGTTLSDLSLLVKDADVPGDAQPQVTIFTANIAGWAAAGSDKVYVRYFEYNETLGKYLIEVEAGPNNGPYRTGVLVADTLADLEAGTIREPTGTGLENWSNPTMNPADAASAVAAYSAYTDFNPGPPVRVGNKWYRCFKIGTGAAKSDIGFAEADSLVGPWTYYEGFTPAFEPGSCCLVPLGDSWIIVGDSREAKSGMYIWRANGKGGTNIQPRDGMRGGPVTGGLDTTIGFGIYRENYNVSAPSLNALRYLKLCKVGDANHQMSGTIIGKNRAVTNEGDYSAVVDINIAQDTAEDGIQWQVRHQNFLGGEGVKVVKGTWNGETWYLLDCGSTSKPFNFTTAAFTGFVTQDPNQLMWVYSSEVTGVTDPLYERGVTAGWSPLYDGTTGAGTMTLQSAQSRWWKTGPEVVAYAYLNVTEFTSAPTGNLLISPLPPIAPHTSYASDVRVTWYNTGGFTLPADFGGWMPWLDSGNNRIAMKYVTNDGTGALKDMPASAVSGTGSDMMLSFRYAVKAKG